mmetsp:Transcript_31099/g.71680  ORF Transcript_31099/g.71680 Transcript_31099/m.71680 type:complete len:201 (-) Transcript_31099:1591-2193(-)
MLSTKASNDICNFLIELSLNGSATYPFDDSLPGTFVCHDDDRPIIQALAATAFGSMIAIQEGSPFWRQRFVQMAAGAVKKGMNGGNSMGKLALCAYIVVNGNIASFSKETVSILSNEIAQGVAWTSLAGSSGLWIAAEPTVLRCLELGLSATAKLFTLAPLSVSMCCVMTPSEKRLLTHKNKTKDETDSWKCYHRVFETL